MSILVSGAVKQAFDIKDKDKCQCGNYRVVVHCPQCGSGQCYASKRNDPQVLLPGTTGLQKVRAFRCKLCSNVYSEDQCASACVAVTRFREKQAVEEKIERLTKVNPQLQRQIIEGLKNLDPQRYANARLPGEPLPQASSADARESMFEEKELPLEEKIIRQNIPDIDKE